MQKVIGFVDYSNLKALARSRGKRPDLVSLRTLLAGAGQGRQALDFLVYAPLPRSEPEGEGLRRYYGFLRRQGFQVITKRAKLLPNQQTKCNMDAELILDAIEIAESARPDVIVLVTGDGDMATLALRLRRRGIMVEVAALPEGLASELRLAANSFIDLSTWADSCQSCGTATFPGLHTSYSIQPTA